MTTLHGVRANALLPALVFCVALLLCMMPAAGATFNVLVNGRGVRLPEPPVERGGRVFVPVRGIFESLGAGVVYDKGTINATAGDKTVQVKIGSNQAIVNGQSQYLDAASFVVGATTMVPLRFVSEALGATVNYNDRTGTIAIETAAAQAKATIPSGAAIIDRREDIEDRRAPGFEHRQGGGRHRGRLLIGNWIGKSLGTNAGGPVGAAGGYMLTANSKTNFDVPTGSKVTMELTQPLALK